MLYRNFANPLKQIREVSIVSVEDVPPLSIALYSILVDSIHTTPWIYGQGRAFRTFLSAQFPNFLVNNLPKFASMGTNMQRLWNQGWIWDITENTLDLTLPTSTWSHCFVGIGANSGSIYNFIENIRTFKTLCKLYLDQLTLTSIVLGILWKISTEYVIFTEWRQILFNLPFELFSITFIVCFWFPCFVFEIFQFLWFWNYTHMT